MKKLFLLLALVLIVMSFAGCGDKKEETNSGEPVVIVDDNETPAPVENNEENGNPVIELDPYVANIPNEIIEFYEEKVRAINSGDMNAKALKYDLVFFDDNNTPELVVTLPGSRMILYTYDAGKVIYTQSEYEDEMGWPFGAGGNAGYEFCPRANLIQNLNSDHAGLIRYTTYFRLDPETHQLVEDKTLCTYHFNDKNNNNEIDEDEMEEYVEEGTKWFVGDKEVSKEEFDSELYYNAFVTLEGTKSFDEIIKALESLINVK